MKLFLLVLLLPAFLATAAEPQTVLLWPKGAPGSEGKTEKEKITGSSVTGVHQPSVLVYLPPKDKATGCAVVVCPGGGHRNLAIEHEGYNVGKWLSERGIAAFVLKYRLARETNSTYSVEGHALADTQRAIRLVRARAGEWGVNVNSVGVIGFSAGGELAALAAVRYDAGNATAADPLDRESSKPSFHGLIYPAIPKEMKITKDTPPVFLACGYKDRQNISEGLAELYLVYKRAGVPADLHIYSSAGHGFGVREKNLFPAGAWTTRFQEWLADEKFLGKR
jgi:acetyl esterase/lipase